VTQPLNIRDLVREFDPQLVGKELHNFAQRLYPICRSITGAGIRETLQILGERLPLKIHEVPSGTQVLDWTVPPEWNVREAWVQDPCGRKIIDFKRHNLHVLNYSVPVRGKFTLDELKPHLFSAPAHPDVIPYRTSYYSKNWGFCMTHHDLEALQPGIYDVLIDSTLEPGYLSYGELFLPGKSENTVLISTHCCHPSLANDNLSGISIAAQLARQLVNIDRQFSYRFIFVPATIGALTWLARNESQLKNITHGLVLSCLGDSGEFTYKKSRRGDAVIDRIVRHVLKTSGHRYKLMEFSPYGYDERQYCSPGFNLPVGCLMRTPHGQFPEYHTSADNLDFITPKALGGSLEILLRIIEVLENNRRYLNTSPKGEPQLNKRGIYSTIHEEVMAMLWMLNLSDGKNSLLDIAERSGVAFGNLVRAADKLTGHGLLKVLDQVSWMESK
jgi:aminopeptidase-like protein